MTRSDAALLAIAANRARARTGFLGYDLASYRAVTGYDPRQTLDVDDRQFDRLALCRTPRRGLQFADDLFSICAHVGVDPVSLAGLLRLTEVLPILKDLGVSAEDHSDYSSVALLAAARDPGDEHTALADGVDAGVGLPGWLHEAVEHFWDLVPVLENFPRDLDFALLVGLPLAMVELPQLSLRTVSKWLGAHGINVGFDDGRDRRLRACLVALGGVGLVFVDVDDDATQRRVSLAHEAAHFIVEYVIPRSEVARRRPELLDVIDGRRPPTSRERISAAIGDVPIGAHTHLIDRLPEGHTATGRADESEWRARRVALELLAPQATLLRRMRESGLRGVDEVRRVLVEDFGLPVSLADDYAGQLLRIASPSRRGLLDLLGPQHRVSGNRPSAAESPEENQSQHDRQ